ncbi:hypothetical protein DNY71_26805 [Salmonella enterica subsp. enterica serovar Typhimurium]|nr:hypothetical protein [Salmonella enterica subsp. enterica serovar Typhimurium]
MLPSETMIWQPEFTDKTLSRKPGAVHTALVERYGEAAVLALENNNTPHRWTVEELKEIRLAALADLRALKKLEAA